MIRSRRVILNQVFDRVVRVVFTGEHIDRDILIEIGQHIFGIVRQGIDAVGREVDGLQRCRQLCRREVDDDSGSDSDNDHR